MWVLFQYFTRCEGASKQQLTKFNVPENDREIVPLSVLTPFDISERVEKEAHRRQVTSVGTMRVVSGVGRNAKNET